MTTPPAVPGFHYYWFLVDGVSMNDPASETYFGWGRQSSGVEVPGRRARISMRAKDVPHGDVRVRWYYAKTTQAWRRAYVYTPAEYDRECRARATRCCTCNTARARTSAAGPLRGGPTSSWTT